MLLTLVHAAGEVEFDDDQQLVKWSNLSGTYRCPDSMAFQAGLALDKFWAIKEVQHTVAREDATTVLVANGVVLEKILSLSDDEVAALRQEWADHLQTLLTTNTQADTCHQKLQEAIMQRQMAIEKYGYLSVAKVDEVLDDADADVVD